MEYKLHHVALKANGEAEFRKAVDFYQNVMGMPLYHSWGQGNRAGAMFLLDGLKLEIVSMGTDSVPNSYWRHIAFDCASPAEVDAMVEKLAAAGCAVTTAPCERMLGEDFPVHLAFVNGPLGEELEFFCAAKEHQG